MKTKNIIPVVIYFLLIVFYSGIAHAQESRGSYYSGKYPNLFTELLGKDQSSVKEKIDTMISRLFYGNDENQRVYYPVGSDMAYIKDVNNNDVRTEGMSYGMMITVQLNMKEEFDRIWKWAYTYMMHKEGVRKNYFAWHCRTDGTIIDLNSASDGEEWFVMALFFASAKWGNGKGIFNYKEEAQKILYEMLRKSDMPGSSKLATNLFNKKEKEVVFVPTADADYFTDPSYHLPHYYELWGRWADTNNIFWCSAAEKSRSFFKETVNPVTGLAPDYAEFGGKPYNWGGRNDNFLYDAWRVVSNIAIDYEWFAKDEWAVEECNKLLDFFYSQGISTYGSNYSLEGKNQLAKEHSTGLIAMNASACLAATSKYRKEFVEALWNAPVPSGHYRYYDGMLYMLGMLEVSGNFRIYNLTPNTVSGCSDSAK